MIFEQIEIKGLAHFSYIIGCDQSKKLAVVDPKRDVDTYLEYARKHGAKIALVLETHIHADYASGARELAERSGAELCLSAYDRGEKYEVTFPHREIKEGEILPLGTVTIEVLHTPGHTPEHISFLVRGDAAAERQVFLSGDFLFLGSLGRPDLIGREETLLLARSQYASVRKISERLDDQVLIYPSHGAGSMCGAGMSSHACRSFGAEKLVNPFLSPDLGEDEFVSKLLGNLPPLPSYYPRMKILNSKGPAFLEALPGLEVLSLTEFEQCAADGAVILDTRDPSKYAAQHIEGAVNIGRSASLSTWAAWVLPHDRPIVFLADDSSQAQELSRCLVRVGLDDIRGILDGGMETWNRAGRPVRSLATTSSRELASKLGRGENIPVIDVRFESEWRQGHLEKAIPIMLGDLDAGMERIPKGYDNLAITCAGGYRSAIAASLLERSGFNNLLLVEDGMQGWCQAGLPVV